MLDESVIGGDCPSGKLSLENVPESFALKERIGCENAVHIEDLRPGAILDGILPGRVVTVVAAEPFDDAVNLTYTTADGRTDREILDMDALDGVHVVRPERTGPRYDADPEEFRLAAEALRIKYAALYDPMAAVYSSDIDPLPHQIRAVYEDMLPKVPLRFLLADDPGAGKTVMAGLYVKEMLLRSAAERVVIVCPGGLAEQWHDELLDKFSLDFDVFTPQMVQLSPSGNPFRDHDRLILRMDQVARSDDYRRMFEEVEWDIAIVDEAHRMSAQFRNGYGEVRRTRRFHLGEVLAAAAENLLLMTATPHSGKEEDFQLFLTLLDPDRFAGRYRDDAPHRRTDTTGVMRRMVKEELRTFDGKPLFPERHARTVAYELSDGEMALYRDVTRYVRSGMSAACHVMESDKRRGNSIGFALTILQRRLASSPEAIYRSLQRRRTRLSDLLQDIRKHPESLDRILAPADDLSDNLDVYDNLWEEIDENGQGRLELELDQVVDSATAARTQQELAAEITTLDGLIAEAATVRRSGTDAKWNQLSGILQEHVLDAGTSDQPHKMIVFTEHCDTLNYLRNRIAALLGRQEAVAVIHGGMARNERRVVQERFVNDPEVRILVATDAAGEGLNLQRADLMVNYDLPWNPNRIEQRFGRIHRIGQKRVCWLWNLVAAGTREGDVYRRLLDKIETMDKAYSGRLFNVLGDDAAFHGRSLKDLMMDAILYGDDPVKQAELDQVIDSGVSDGLGELLAERSTHPEWFESLDVNHVRELMERTRERKLQPGYIAAFFLSAFRRLGGTAHLREKGRWELTHVPQDVRRTAQRLDHRHPVTDVYERITFETAKVHPDSRSPEATLIAPGTPLLDAVSTLVLERYGGALDHGTVFVDRTDGQPDEPTLMMAADQRIDDADGRAVSHHFDYVRLGECDAEPRISPMPPYLDYETPKPQDHEAIQALLERSWIRGDHSTEISRFVYRNGTKPRLQELQARRDEENQHVFAQMQTRLNAEIEYWYGVRNQIEEDKRNGICRKRSISLETANERISGYVERLKRREDELTHADRLRPRPAVIRGVALVVPGRMLAARGSADEPESKPFAVSTEEVDRRAVIAAMTAERSVGRTPQEMPHANAGFDIRSTAPDGTVYFIEVKGRVDLPEADTFTVTANEVAFAQSQGDRHRLALVRVSPDGPARDRLRYVLHAFDSIIPAASTRSFNERFADYWNRGGTPQ